MWVAKYSICKRKSPMKISFILWRFTIRPTYLVSVSVGGRDLDGSRQVLKEVEAKSVGSSLTHPKRKIPTHENNPLVPLSLWAPDLGWAVEPGLLDGLADLDSEIGLGLGEELGRVLVSEVGAVLQGWDGSQQVSRTSLNSQAAPVWPPSMCLSLWTSSPSSLPFLL
jgi:hypothetical protein